MYPVNTYNQPLPYAAPQNIEYMQHNTNVMNTYTSNWKASEKFHEMIKSCNMELKVNQAIMGLQNQHIQYFPQFFITSDIYNNKLFPEDLVELSTFLAQEYNMYATEVLTLILGFVAMASRGQYTLKLDNFWSEFITLYLVVAKKSGNKKSALLEHLLKPFQEYQTQLQQAYDSTVKSALVKNDLVKGLVKRKKKQALDELVLLESHDEFESILAQKAAELSQVEALNSKLQNYPYLFVGRQTPVALAKEMERQNGILGICSAEDVFGGLALDNKGGNHDLLLKGYNQESYVCSNGTTKQINIAKPALSMIVLMQPELLKKYYRCQHLVDNGFLNRVTPYLCGDRSTLYSYAIEQPSISELEGQNLLDIYNNKIGSLLRASNSDNKVGSKILRIAPDAYKALKDYECKCEQGLNCYNQRVHGYLRKEHGLAARFAACLHLWKHENPLEVSVSTIDVMASTSLTLTLRNYAQYLLDVEQREIEQNAQRILSWVDRHKYLRFTTNEISGSLNAMPKAKLLPVLEFLAQRYYLCFIETPGRSAICVMHPQYSGSLKA